MRPSQHRLLVGAQVLHRPTSQSVRLPVARQQLSLPLVRPVLQLRWSCPAWQMPWATAMQCCGATPPLRLQVHLQSQLQVRMSPMHAVGGRLSLSPPRSLQSEQAQRHRRQRIAKPT